MSPYREDSAQEPSDGLTAGERHARERHTARRRAITIAVSVPLALVLVVVVVGLLLDLSSSGAPPARTTAPTPVDEPAEAGAEAEAEAPATGRPWGTVTDYCNERCPTYAEAWATLRDGREPPTWCVTGNRAGPCNRVETGTCGALHYVKVDVDPICGGGTRYFDEAGALVGVADVSPSHERSPDGAVFDPLREKIYGHIPLCALVPYESACVKPVR